MSPPQLLSVGRIALRGIGRCRTTRNKKNTSACREVVYSRSLFRLQLRYSKTKARRRLVTSRHPRLVRQPETGGHVSTELFYLVISVICSVVTIPFGYFLENLLPSVWKTIKTGKALPEHAAAVLWGWKRLLILSDLVELSVLDLKLSSP